MNLPGITIVLGGAASGKSRFAEDLILGSGKTPVYIATAQPRDGEMAAKIAAHRVRRGAGWHTVEEPVALHAALHGVAAGAAVLIDCATLWLSNLMLAEADLQAAKEALFAALDHCPAPVVIVSNEVGMGIVPDNALARRFRGAQGGLNQRLAARADLVVLVVAGLPMVLKGALP